MFAVFVYEFFDLALDAGKLSGANAQYRFGSLSLSRQHGDLTAVRLRLDGVRSAKLFFRIDDDVYNALIKLYLYVAVFAREPEKGRSLSENEFVFRWLSSSERPDHS